MRFACSVYVTLREGIADPQGSTIERSLPTLGFDNVEHVRVGKLIRFSMEADDEAAARGQAEELCKRFLTNPVIEDFDVALEASNR